MALQPKKNKSKNKKINNRNTKRTTTEQRASTKGVATPAIHTITQIVEILKPWELSPTNRFKTYQGMLQDDSVWSSVESRITSVEVAQSSPKLHYDKNSERSIEIKNYIEYCINNMKKSTRQVGRDCGEFIYNGISLFETVTKIDRSGGEYDGMFVLDDLTYIDPLTIDPVKPFVTKEGGRELSYWRQMKSAFRDTDGSLANLKVSNAGAIEIDARKVATVSYAASSSRPLGTSPLDAAYTPWREKTLIQEYLLMGIQKDLAGTPVLRVPLDLFDKAKDPNSDAAQTMNQLVEHMTNLHSSDQTFVVLPSDGFEGAGNISQYDISFKGVDGASKMFDLVAILDQKKKAIFTVLGASDLIAGEDGGGSYNLLEGKSEQKSYYSKRDSLIIEDMWNKKIIPMLLRLNNIVIEKESDRVTYKSGEVQPVSLDEYGKYVNRVARLLPARAEVGNALLERMGIDYRIPEDTTPEEYRELLFEFAEPSKTGSGEGSSGSGNTQSGGSQSDNNSENAS